MTVIFTPQHEHQCNPGWRETFHVQKPDANTIFPPPSPTGWYSVPVHHVPGSAVQCACGKVWIALEHVYTGWRVGPRIVHGGWNDYRPETRRERRRRERLGHSPCVETL